MKTSEKVAIYLDHYRAEIFEYSENTKRIQIIKSEFNAVEKNEILQKGEDHLHYKEQKFQRKFFLNIKKVLHHFDNILLFGTTNAKTELIHVLQEDKTFSTKNIFLKDTDRLTENQKVAFINNFFS